MRTLKVPALFPPPEAVPVVEVEMDRIGIGNDCVVGSGANTPFLHCL
jgi:hypothetical protein